tara:strand:- start:1228 stop:2067 length:840 start_codon:yes stop_codon:yes gene_type:complete
LRKHFNKKKIIGISAPKSILAKNFIKKFRKKYSFLIYKQDITNSRAFDKWIKLNKNINIFINFAAITSKIDCEKFKSKALNVNYKGVVGILKILNKNYLDNFYYFLSLSSSHVFKKSNRVLNEKSFKQPDNYYGVSKLFMEKYIYKNKNNYKFKIAIARIFNYFTTDTKKSFFVNDVIKKLKSKKKLITFKSVDTYRDFVDIDDLVNSLDFLLENKLAGEYNVSSGRKYFLKDIIKEININYKKKLKFFDTKKKSLIGSNLKIVNKGFKFKKLSSFKNL